MTDEQIPGQLSLFAPDALFEEPAEARPSEPPPEDLPEAEGEAARPQAAPRLQYVVFDVETQKSFDEVGGRSHKHKLGISVAVTYNSRTDAYTSYREHELEALVAELRDTDLVVGFNHIGFDYPVLQAYTDFDLYTLPSLDIMLSLEHSLGYRIALDKVASATLGVGKSGHGLQAIEWFRDGEWDKLIKYCRQDVKVTKEIYEFGRDNGFLYIPAAGDRRKVDVKLDG